MFAINKKPKNKNSLSKGKRYEKRRRVFTTGFTLIELLIVLAIIAILVTVVLVALKPAEFMKKARDSRRIVDLQSLNKALSLAEFDNVFMGNASTTYISVPDPNANPTSTCSGMGLPSLPTGWTYQCSSPSNYRKTDGTGWIPVNFSSLTTVPGALSILPVDPINSTSTNLYYTYVKGSWELTALLESTEYQQKYAEKDGGTSSVVYEIGNMLKITPSVIASRTNTGGGGGGGGGGGSWLSGYSYRKKITIDETKIDENLTDFPVLVKLDSTNFNFSHARSDGYDIRFTSSDGTTLLKYERERHNAASQVAEYWVRIPNISASTNTEFYIYYGKSDASDGADPTNVWDSNFKLALHLKETSGTHYDSTSNANNGTPYNGVVQGTTAKIDGGDSFDGSNDYISIAGTGLMITNAPITVSAWVKISSAQKAYTLEIGACNRGPSVDQRGYGLYDDGNGKIRFTVNKGQNGFSESLWDDVITTVAINDGNWHHLVGVFTGNGTTRNKIYVDGVEAWTSNAGQAQTYLTSYTTSEGQKIGKLSTLYTQGLIDEVRIYNRSLSADEIRQLYVSNL